jgi:SAM-dependent methyltransferase
VSFVTFVFEVFEMTDDKQKVREFYDEIGWQQEADGHYQNTRYEDMRPVSAEYISKTRLRVNDGLVPTGKLLLDAGSGPVQYDEYLTYSRGYYKRVCLDVSFQALRDARERIGDHGLFVIGDLANLPFKSDAFDGEVSMHAVHHLPLEEHPRAYDELHRVLTPGRTGVIVNGWQSPKLMLMAEPLIRLVLRLNGLALRLTGRGPKKQPEPVNSKKPEGTFVTKTTPEWFKREIGNRMPLEIRPWRSLSTRILRLFVYPQLGGKLFLKFVFWLEGVFPEYFGENGQYPMIVIKKE